MSNELENYEFHRTHTPESPQPIYPPEPSNIPLLKNQNDPSLTAASTYNSNTTSQLLAVEANGAAQQINELDHTSTDKSANGAAALPESNDDSTRAAYGDVQASQSNGLQPFPNQIDPQSAYQPYMTNAQDISISQTEPQLSQTLQALSSAAPSGNATQIDSSPAIPSATGQTPAQEVPQQADPSSSSARNVRENIAQRETQGESHKQEGGAEGVNYQSLLDTLTRSTSAAPSAANVSAQAANDPSDTSFAPASDMQAPPAAGLPPRPPQNANVPVYPEVHAPASSTQMYDLRGGPPSFSGSLPPMPIAGNAPGTVPGSSGLPPPPLGATFFPGAQDLQQPASASLMGARPSSASGSEDGEHKWGPEVQVKYDQFLTDERTYVTEGVWDKFPLGSRMFVGNLPTEKVTKRDLFHIFHKYGKLAQISIKQAYGFVQFLDAADCARALEVEQSVTIRGRRLHLEISKPQKNTRGTGQGEGNRQAGRKRSRSPDRRGGRRGQDRPPYSDYRDEPGRRRDEYRPGQRSPSPRGFRARDDYRPRSGYRERSPQGRSGGRRRSPSPSRGFDDEASLPLPRRHPTEIPDIQIVILDEVDRNFVAYLENALRSRGLQCQSLALTPRLSLAAVVKRQIIEGVQAIIKLSRSSQYSGKVPLQVFDRSTGIDVKFNEYIDLDVSIAAEIVLQNKRNQRPLAPNAYPQYGSTPAMTGYSQQAPVPLTQGMGSQDPSVTNLISNLDGPALQKLLSAMQQPPHQPQASATLSPTSVGPSSQGGNPDLASLLTSVARQQQQQQQQPGLVPPSFQQPGQQPYGGSAQAPQNMQNIMNQLAQFRR